MGSRIEFSAISTLDSSEAGGLCRFFLTRRGSSSLGDSSVSPILPACCLQKGRQMFLCGLCRRFSFRRTGSNASSFRRPCGAARRSPYRLPHPASAPDDTAQGACLGPRVVQRMFFRRSGRLLVEPDGTGRARRAGLRGVCDRRLHVDRRHEAAVP